MIVRFTQLTTFDQQGGGGAGSAAQSATSQAEMNKQLLIAAKDNEEDEVRSLLAQGANPDWKNKNEVSRWIN